jgi:hypothetical protein
MQSHSAVTCIRTAVTSEVTSDSPNLTSCTSHCTHTVTWLVTPHCTYTAQAAPIISFSKLHPHSHLHCIYTVNTLYFTLHSLCTPTAVSLLHLNCSICSHTVFTFVKLIRNFTLQSLYIILLIHCSVTLHLYCGPLTRLHTGDHYRNSTHST